ncbi:MAG TPA: hypothetical protein VJW20_22515 [Candidatus Angelobacter sp.]|nr:hypothetical protein [Candidatus Angelobacter sp.]
MNDYLLRAVKGLFYVIVLAALTGAAFGDSVSLNGSGTLSYTVVDSGLTPCIPGSTFLIPSYEEWDFSNFVFTDATGVNHSLPGSTSYFQVNGDDPSCPPAGGFSVTLTDNAPEFFIIAQPNQGSITASLNVELYPKYKIISLLYDAPGNRSSNGYTNSVNNTVSASISHTFSSATATSVSGSFAGIGYGVSFSASKSTQDSAAFQFSTSNGSGVSLGSVGNSVDHSQDQFLLWLNPMVVVTPTSTSSATYSMSTPMGSNGQPEPMDIVNINVEDLQNPSLIPIGVLQPQVRNNVSSLPGLANICANPVPSCTSAPCGCVTSDFSAILASDPLISIPQQNTQPSQIDPNRYVLVNSQILEGPQCEGCDPVTNSFNESDSQSTSQTLTQTFSYTVGYTRTSGFSLFGAGLTLATSNSFGWSNSMSTGTANGTSHGASITLGSSSVGCDETINIYEDTVYHTFALAPAVVSSLCN